MRILGQKGKNPKNQKNLIFLHLSLLLKKINTYFFKISKNQVKKNTLVTMYFLKKSKKIKRFILQKWKEKKCLKIKPLNRKSVSR